MIKFVPFLFLIVLLYMDNYRFYPIADYRKERVTLKYYLEIIDSSTNIRIISPHHDLKGNLDEDEFYHFAVDLEDMRVYNIFIDEEANIVFELGAG